MISRELLIKHFEKLVEFEDNVRRDLDDCMSQLSDEFIIGQLKIIHDEEVKHVKQAEKLLRILLEE